MSGPLKAAWAPPPPQLPPDPDLASINPAHLIASDWGKPGDSSIEKNPSEGLLKDLTGGGPAGPLGEGAPTGLDPRGAPAHPLAASSLRTKLQMDKTHGQM